jgi:hypothetical protein
LRTVLPPRDEAISATLRRRVAFFTCATNAASSFIASAVDERNGWILESSLSATGLLKSMAKSWLRL